MSLTLAIFAFLTLGGSVGGFFLVRKIKEALNEENRRKGAEAQLEAKQNEAEIHAAPRRSKPVIIDLMRERADQ